MREFSEDNLTEAVVERFANTPDPRLKLLITSLVRHLQAYVRDVEPIFDEWMAAINFLSSRACRRACGVPPVPPAFALAFCADNAAGISKRKSRIRENRAVS